MENNLAKSNLGKRFLAGLIDYSIIWTFYYVFLYTFGEQNEEGSYSFPGILSLVPILFWFIFTILFEFLFGATLGNSIVKLKPKSLTHTKGELSFKQSIKRHLLDPIDMFPLGLIGILTIKYTDRNQRLGDIWVKTIIIEKKQLNSKRIETSINCIFNSDELSYSSDNLVNKESTVFRMKIYNEKPDLTNL